MMMKNKEKEAGVEERPIRVSNTFKRCGGGIKANSLRKRFLKKPSEIRLSGVPPIMPIKTPKT